MTAFALVYLVVVHGLCARGLEPLQSRRIDNTGGSGDVREGFSARLLGFSVRDCDCLTVKVTVQVSISRWTVRPFKTFTTWQRHNFKLSDLPTSRAGEFCLLISWTIVKPSLNASRRKQEDTRRNDAQTEWHTCMTGLVITWGIALRVVG